MSRLVLASSSPQRQRLLAQAGYAFDVIVPAECEPDPTLFADARAYVAHTAWIKARQVTDRVPDGIIIAADTTVMVAGRIMGKPADRSDAERILQGLSGTVHQCLTGLCLWNRPKDIWTGAVDITELRMRPLSSEELEAYLKSDRWVGKAGAYAIQDPDPYVSIIHGSHSNVVGLPLELLGRMLQSLGIPAPSSGRPARDHS